MNSMSALSEISLLRQSKMHALCQFFLKSICPFFPSLTRFVNIFGAILKRCYWFLDERKLGRYFLDKEFLAEVCFLVDVKMMPEPLQSHDLYEVQDCHISNRFFTFSGRMSWSLPSPTEGIRIRIHDSYN